jgi:hypothetical protein
MSYNDKIELVANEMVKFAKRKIEMEFDGTLKTICESTMSIDEMNATMEKYIRLQVKTMNLWSV